MNRRNFNFQLSVILCVLVSMLLITLVSGIGVLVVAAIVIASLVLTIVAALKANQGIAYRYPLKITWIK